jgi:GH15 family glucan-1,4-alpha-glucosidase
MPRDLPIGNGSLLVAFDAQYRLADFYFPHVGMENQAAAKFRFGVFADGTLSSTDDVPWQRTLDYLRDTLVTDVQLQNDALGLRLRCYDAVDPDRRIYVRKIVARNLENRARDVKLFFHHDFALYGSGIGDTAFFDPSTHGIIHFKSKRFILINCDPGVHEYACARSALTGAPGTWQDAEDGELAMTAIAQGAVESAIAVPLHLESSGSATLFYWICAGRTYDEVRALHEDVRTRTAARVLAQTGSHWYTWVNKPDRDLSDLPDEITELYRRSLLVIATQCDAEGGVMAANDSDIQWGHNDHYSYVWTRDASLVCDAMDRAGFPEITRRFLLFAKELIREEGFFLHKYNPDGSPAPLWHPWVADGELQLPIQLDETALVIWLVARHYERTRDLDLLRAVYPRLVVAAADFLVRYRDPERGLPLPAFDLWEERKGTFTFTCATVVAGLQAAADLANLFNEQERRAIYAKAASEVRDAMKKHFWMEEESRLARGFAADGSLDTTVDASSAFGAFYFGAFPPASGMVEGTMRAVRERLWVQTETGGIARYENDDYHRISSEPARVPGNPWILCTLWLAEHRIATAGSVAELQSALDLVRWARAKATASLILPEQVDPYDGQPLSVAPLTWSHAQVVSVVHAYLDALRKLRDVPNRVDFLESIT